MNESVIELRRTNGAAVTRQARIPAVPKPRRALAAVPEPEPGREPAPGLRERAQRLGEFLYRRVAGDYRVDEFGFDAELADNVMLPAMRLLYDNWFRVRVTGERNLPAEGGALLVANHSGTLPWDAAMTAIAVHDNSPGNRHLRALGADLVFSTPALGSFARKSGMTLACNADAERLLDGGNLVGVWPEGFKGVGKPFSERYKLQRFGRGGFVAAAMRSGVPIIPVSIVGAEEIYPKIADLKPLARLLGLPYFPITPFFPLFGPLGAIPLPTRWHIDFGEPIHPGSMADAEEDPMLMLNLTDQVRETIQQTLYRLLDTRTGVFR